MIKTPMNKKGMFFTLMTIIILSIFLFSTVFYSDYLKRENAQKRVETLDAFVFSSEKDMSRLIYVNGYRAIFVLEKRIVDYGQYQPNVMHNLQEAFFNGTINGVPEELLNGTNFTSMVLRIRQNAFSINANVSITNPVLVVEQVDPWNVRYNLTADYYFYDLTGTVSWKKTLEVLTDIPINNFNDPLYMIGTNNLVPNKFVKTPFSGFSSSDIENLTKHVNNSYYIANESAPSFLNRLAGNFSKDVNGIESIVNLHEISEQSSHGLTPLQKSLVDYVYFNSTNNIGSCIIRNPVLPADISWLRLNSSNFGVYGVVGC